MNEKRETRQFERQIRKCMARFGYRATPPARSQDPIGEYAARRVL
jgi:hypothetical protein